MPQDWFTQNAPKPTVQPPLTPVPSHAPSVDWFAKNSPDENVGNKPSARVDPRATAGNFITDATIGAWKGALETVKGGGQLLRSAFPVLDRGPEVQIPVNLEATNTAQSVGKGVERVAEYFAPAGLVGRAKGLVRTGSGILDALVGAGIEGASAAGVSSAQQGSTEGALTTAAVSGGVGLGMQGAMKAMGALGRRTEEAILKPSAADYKDGFQVSTVFRHQLGGSLAQTFEKTQARIKTLSGELDEALKSEPTATVDLHQIILDAADELKSQGMKNVGRTKEVQTQLNWLLDEIDNVLGPEAHGVVNLSKANEAKQAIGLMGAWFHNPGAGPQAVRDSSALEAVANTVYGRLKQAIHDAVPGGRVNALNRQISELIPVQRAVVRRIPVESRSNVIGLGDMLAVVGGGPSGAAMGISQRILKSGTAANAMVGAGEKADRLSALAARLAAAGLQPVASHEVKR